MRIAVGRTVRRSHDADVSIGQGYPAEASTAVGSPPTPALQRVSNVVLDLEAETTFAEIEAIRPPEPVIEAMIWHYAKGKPTEHINLARDEALLAHLDQIKVRKAQNKRPCSNEREGA